MPPLLKGVSYITGKSCLTSLINRRFQGERQAKRIDGTGRAEEGIHGTRGHKRPQILTFPQFKYAALPPACGGRLDSMAAHTNWRNVVIVTAAVLPAGDADDHVTDCNAQAAPSHLSRRRRPWCRESDGPAHWDPPINLMAVSSKLFPQ